MSKTNSKFKTITFENHNEGAAKNLISVEQCVKNLEKSITLPLSENLSFHQIVLLSEEKKYKQQLIDSSNKFCFI